MREPSHLNLLVKLVKRPDLSAEEKARFMRSFDYYPKSPEKDKALLEILN
jgi:hypothetical protein